VARRSSSVPAEVLRAWGVTTVTALRGGQGSTFASADLVLKPVIEVDEAVWIAEVLDSLPPQPDLRVIRPVRTVDGHWTMGGWVAFERLEGSERAGDWRSALDVSDRFHHLVADIPWSPVLQRAHPWAVGDAFAWGERGFDVPPRFAPVFERLQAGLTPLDEPAQLIHGDLCNNILFHDLLPPAVIDVSPFWRPKRYADAIAVIDAIGWFHATAHALEPLMDDTGRQLVLRATLFRLGSAVVLMHDDHDRLAREVTAYERILDALGL
jgi:uncharacterized protein (TIGR02569 family)